MTLRASSAAPVQPPAALPAGPTQPITASASVAAYRPPPATPPPAPPTPLPRRRHGWRWTGAIVVLLLAALLATVSVVARYARGEIINTDRYVATVTTLASDPAVQDAVAARVSSEVIKQIDVPRLIDELATATGRPNADAIASVISGPVTGYVQSFVQKTVLRFVRSSQFQKLWVNANTVAHTQLSAVLTGKGSNVVRTEGDQIILEIGPIVAQVKQELVNSGFSVASAIPTVSVQIPVMTVQNLPRIQSYVNLLNTVATWLPLIAIILLGLGIWLAPRHRRGALIGAVMIAVLMVIMLIALKLVRNAYSNEVANRNLDVPAALAIYDTLLRYLVQAIGALLLVSIVAAVWLWLAGPGRVGTFLRHWGRRGEQWLAGQVDRTPLRFGPVPRFTARYGRWFVIVAGILAAFGLLLSPTIGRALWLSAGVLLVMLVVGILSRLREPAAAVPATA